MPPTPKLKRDRSREPCLDGQTSARAKPWGVASTEDGPEKGRLRRWTNLPERNPWE